MTLEWLGESFGWLWQCQTRTRRLWLLPLRHSLNVRLFDLVPHRINVNGCLTDMVLYVQMKLLASVSRTSHPPCHHTTIAEIPQMLLPYSIIHTIPPTVAQC